MRLKQLKQFIEGVGIYPRPFTCYHQEYKLIMTNNVCCLKELRKKEQLELVKVIGVRMVEARKLCGLTQINAAKLLGYSNSSKLAKIENASDTDSVPFMLIHKASGVYKVSMDFLYGVTDVYERDPVLAQQKQIEQWLFNQYSTIREDESKQLKTVLKRVVDLEGVAANSAKRAVKNIETLERMIVINPECENNLKGLAKLQRLLIETAEEAVEIDRQLKNNQNKL
ncbi:MAG: hypothetical protein QM500_16395 [Methylococcales bacterium]